MEYVLVIVDLLGLQTIVAVDEELVLLHLYIILILSLNLFIYDKRLRHKILILIQNIILLLLTPDKYTWVSSKTLLIVMFFHITYSLNLNSLYIQYKI